MDPYKKEALVLLSGGIDSTACIHYYIKMGFNVTGFFVNYGQKARNFELISARNIASFYRIKMQYTTFYTTKEFETGEIQGRNGFLIMAALLNNPRFQGLISLGIHDGTFYYDCTSSFVQSMNLIIKEYTDGRVSLDVPFLTWNKKMIYDFCKDESVPIYLTYSCENGENIPCGKCLSCLDRSYLK